MQTHLPEAVTRRVALVGLAAAAAVLAICFALLLAPTGGTGGDATSAELRLQGVDGRPMALSDHRGKIVLLLVGDEGQPIWGEGYAEVAALIDRYADERDVKVMAVQQSAGAAPRPMPDALATVPVMLDPASRTSLAFGTHGRSAVVVGPRGQVVDACRVDQAPARIAPLLGRRPPPALKGGGWGVGGVGGLGRCRGRLVRVDWPPEGPHPRRPTDAQRHSSRPDRRGRRRTRLVRRPGGGAARGRDADERRRPAAAADERRQHRPPLRRQPARPHPARRRQRPGRDVPRRLRQRQPGRRRRRDRPARGGLPPRLRRPGQPRPPAALPELHRRQRRGPGDGHRAHHARQRDQRQPERRGPQPGAAGRPAVRQPQRRLDRLRAARRPALRPAGRRRRRQRPAQQRPGHQHPARRRGPGRRRRRRLHLRPRPELRDPRRQPVRRDRRGG